LAGLSSAAAGQLPAGDGAILGVVVHDGDGQTPVAGAEVVLRVALDGQFVPVEKTIADSDGRFVFQGLPVGPGYLYLPGANHQGVHYPGPRVRLGGDRIHVRVKIEVSDAATGSNPLVARRHDIVIRPQPGALEVTETILIENPTSASYLGATDSDDDPVTLQLSVPSDFEKTTFEKEFFGRNFSLRDGKLVTSIPWTPGKRELEFTYVLRNVQSQRVWERPLDLPTDRVRVTVVSDKPEEVSCNLDSDSDAAAGTVVFQSGGDALPPGYVLRVELGELPVSWTAYARWAALAILAALIAAVSAIAMRRRAKQPPTAAVEPSPRAASAVESAPRKNTRQKRRKRKNRSRTRRAA